MLKADGSGPAPTAVMSEELPQTSNQDEETKIFYYIDEEDTPYLIKLPGVRKDQVTLSAFKLALQLHNRPNSYKFFFKSLDTDMGVVKEEIHDDKARLPLCENGRIVSWVGLFDG